MYPYRSTQVMPPEETGKLIADLKDWLMPSMDGVRSLPECLTFHVNA